MVGFIKIHRKLQSWEWYNKSEMVHLFIHLLINANVEDKSWQNIIIKRGQLVTGIHSLSDKTGISVRTIRTCLERLKSTSELTIKSTNKFSIVTICKYDDYNDNKKSTDKQIDTQTGTQTTTTKKYKKKESIYNSNTLLSELKNSDFTDDSDLENFKIASAFVEVFKKNKKDLGDENIINLEQAKYISYVDPIRLLKTRDKRTKEEIKIVYDYLKGPNCSFWKPNVLCTSKLREKFSRLLIAAKDSKNNNKNLGNNNEQTIYTPNNNKIDHTQMEEHNGY